MGILLWASKPLLYVLMFGIAAHRFRRTVPEFVAKVPLVAIGGGLGRVLAGGLIAFALARFADAIPGAALFAIFALLGVGAWIGVARLAFRNVPLRSVVLFGVVGEIVGGSIDLLAIREAQNIRIC